MLFTLLPILKTQVLEDLLGERISLSGFVVMTYHSVIDRLRSKLQLSPSQSSEISSVTLNQSPLLQTQQQQRELQQQRMKEALDQTPAEPLQSATGKNET